MVTHPQNRDTQLETSGKVIGFYEREFYPFSNFSSFMVEWREQLWPTSEHAYQASKFFGSISEVSAEILVARSADQALRLARQYEEQVQENWDEIKIGVMIDICRHKLQQHVYVQKKLLQTEDILLVEDSPKDSFWGWGPDRRGRNELGKIWMRLRDELREGKL